MQKENILKQLSRDDSLDIIQKYVLKHVNIEEYDKKDISSEMFRLFFYVIELGKEIRISLKTENTSNSKSKIADVFLVLISICNNLEINLFDAFLEKEQNRDLKLA